MAMGKPKSNVHQELFQFRGPGDLSALCDLEIIRTDDQTVVIVTERKDNPGASVTNAIQHLIPQVCKRHRVDIRKVVWIEHYNANSYTYKGKVPGKIDYYSLVIFKFSEDRLIQKPAWRPMTDDDWRELGLVPRVD